MKGMFKKTAYYFLMMFAVIFYSCQTPQEPETLPDDNIREGSAQKINADQFGEQAKEIITSSVKVSVDVFKKYVIPDKLPEPGTLPKTNAVDFRFENGYYIWEGDIVGDVPEYPEAIKTQYLRKIQFKESKKGAVLDSPENANYMSFSEYVHTEFGFVGGEPYGDKTDIKVQGDFNNLLTKPVLNAYAEYNRMWYGLYNEQPAQLDIKAKVYIVNMVFTPNPDGTYNLDGKLIVRADPYKVIVVCKGNVALLMIYKNCVKISKSYVEIPQNILQMDLLPLNLFRQ